MRAQAQAAASISASSPWHGQHKAQGRREAQVGRQGSGQRWCWAPAKKLVSGAKQQGGEFNQGSCNGGCGRGQNGCPM